MNVQFDADQYLLVRLMHSGLWAGEGTSTFGQTVVGAHSSYSCSPRKFPACELRQEFSIEEVDSIMVSAPCMIDENRLVPTKVYRIVPWMSGRPTGWSYLVLAPSGYTNYVQAKTAWVSYLAARCVVEYDGENLAYQKYLLRG